MPRGQLWGTETHVHKESQQTLLFENLPDGAQHTTVKKGIQGYEVPQSPWSSAPGEVGSPPYCLELSRLVLAWMGTWVGWGKAVTRQNPSSEDERVFVSERGVFTVQRDGKAFTPGEA